MNGPAEFLAARLDDDEATAKAAEGAAWFLGSSEDSDQRSVRYTGQSTLNPAREWDYAVADRVEEGSARHMTRHDPARVLREVAAGRADLRAYEAVKQAAETDDTRWRAGQLFTMEAVIRNRATVYSDHPDYQPEWAP